MSPAMYISPESLRRLDELTRSDLQNLRDSYFNLLLMSTAVVFFGVLLEGPEIFREIAEEVRRLLPPRLRLNSATGVPVVQHESGRWIRVSSLFRVSSLLGWALVIIGVIGEGVFEGLMSKADGSLGTFNEILLSSTIDRASENEKEAARLNNIAEEEKSARLAIQRQLSWRTLTPAQAKRIRAKLTPFAGEQFDLATYSSEGECASFVNELYHVALSGGWALASRRIWRGDPMSLVIGVEVTATDKAEVRTKNAAAALSDALKAEGIMASAKLVPEVELFSPHEQILIVVGKNPSSMKPLSVPKK
jgi:hypothetical protein